MYSTAEPITSPAINRYTLFPFNFLGIHIRHIAPNPYMQQNGPYKNDCLLSITPFVNIPNIVSIIYPQKLYTIK